MAWLRKAELVLHCKWWRISDTFYSGKNVTLFSIMKGRNLSPWRYWPGRVSFTSKGCWISKKKPSLKSINFNLSNVLESPRNHLSRNKRLTTTEELNWTEFFLLWICKLIWFSSKFTKFTRLDSTIFQWSIYKSNHYTTETPTGGTTFK